MEGLMLMRTVEGAPDRSAAVGTAAAGVSGSPRAQGRKDWPMMLPDLCTVELNRALVRGRYPPHLVYGPLAFPPTLERAVGAYAEGNPMAMVGSPPWSRRYDRVAFPGEELVVVSAPFLPTPLTRGYDEPFGYVVKDVDGVPVWNLRHLVELLGDGTGEFVTSRFFGDIADTLVFPRKRWRTRRPS
jgi:hypothetical protein